jgi:hypothetical protein
VILQLPEPRAGKSARLHLKRHCLSRGLSEAGAAFLLEVRETALDRHRKEADRLYKRCCAALDGGKPPPDVPKGPKTTEIFRHLRRKPRWPEVARAWYVSE